ncbi:MAG: endo-1,4-beta-xylanase, partial [Prolixibacteraceae bacterium]|nr:endo-1,4-beta-xylanase [Prolixibacteraceae bacterium]
MSPTLKSLWMKHILTLLILITVNSLTHETVAQSYQTWYRNAQERIDTLRKGDFGIKIIGNNGVQYEGPVSVRMNKHEYPFGAAFDFYEGEASMGNKYSTSASVQADEDAEIYQTERWDKYLAYAIPLESGKDYIVTLKFAEIYHGGNNARIFDVKVEGQLFLNDFDTHKLAGGKDIAIDTSLLLTINDEFLHIELNASVDNVAIKGIVVETVDGQNIVRINCGGAALTTASGNQYQTEDGFFDPDVNTVASREQWMKAAMFKYFNAGVSGNSFKWSGIQSRHTEPDYTNFNNAVNWTQKVGWDLRAHTLLWGGNDAHSMPDWVRELPTPQAITDTCKMRVIREVTKYKGIIKEYDVLNEPLSGHADWLRKTVGDSIIWNSFKWARSADPDAELYINDYNVEYNWGQALEYRDLILKMLENGAPVTGVGVQAHFWNCCRPNVDELVKNLNIIAETGLPIKLTEFDYSEELSQEEQTADYIKVLTIAFSHPSIVGIMHWAIGDEGAWRPNTGLFDANLKPKLAADTLLYYTKTKWATNFDSILQQNDPLVFNAYYGHYQIEAEINGQVMVWTLPLLKSNADSIFTLNMADAMLKSPQLVQTELTENQEIRLWFDKDIQPNSLKRSEFKIFSASNIGLEAVAPEPANSKAVLLTMSTAVQAGEYLAVAYVPGMLMATDGSRAGHIGPEAVPNPAKSNGIFMQHNGLLSVFPNPATNLLQVKFPEVPYKIEIYNSLGLKIISEISETE